MKTQDEIVARIKANPHDIHGNETLFSFLDVPHQKQVMGDRLLKQMPARIVAEFTEIHTARDAGPMLVDLLTQGRKWEPVAGNDFNERIQRMRKERTRALVWLVDGDEFFDWTRSLRDLIDEIEARYAPVTA